MPSPTEELNRLNRALPIAFALIASGINSQMAVRSNPGTIEHDGKDSPDWKLAAQLAGFTDGYVPSIETQMLIVRLLVDFENMQRSISPLVEVLSKSSTEVTIEQAQTDPESSYLEWAAATARWR